METAVLAWSGGKDAAFALSEVFDGDAVDIVELYTTINEATDRSSMHGVHRDLYDRQAAALGLPLNVIELPADPSNDEYEAVMTDALSEYADRGIRRVIFADLFLEDIRAYREDLLATTDLEGYWPLWNRDTDTHIRAVLEAGFKATVVAVDTASLDPSFVGRELDEQFLADLPPDVDPSGEHGEFHTFVWDGPTFAEPVPVKSTRTVTRSAGDTEITYADLQLRSV